MRTILIVDDENSLRMLVAATLEGKRFSILQAKNGLEAIRVGHIEKPDLILLDLMMPGFSGMEALKIFKKSEITKNIPVIILTAKGQPEDRKRAFDLGADCFLVKPFSPLEFLNLVDRILKGEYNRLSQEGF